jgi:hypothetical protein
MEPLTPDMLRALAQERGLALTDAELAGLLPLVEAGRGAIAALDELVVRDDEPSSHFHIL